jgi:hypothetical protein
MEKKSKRVEVNPKETDTEMIGKYTQEYTNIFIKAPVFKAARSSIKLAFASGGLDFKSMERAFRANFTHSVDGLIIRRIISEVRGPVLTIHDCAGVRLLEVRSLKEAAKVAYSNVSFSCCGKRYKTSAIATSDFLLN